MDRHELAQRIEQELVATADDGLDQSTLAGVALAAAAAADERTGWEKQSDTFWRLWNEHTQRSGGTLYIPPSRLAEHALGLAKRFRAEEAAKDDEAEAADAWAR